MAINTQKVVVAGLASGVVLAALDFVINGLILAETNRAAMEAINPGLAANMESATGAVALVVIDLLLGVVLAWTYAAVRPRFGPGPKTAAIAGGQVFVIMALAFAFLSAGGLFSWGYYVIGSVSELVILMVAVQVAGKLYTEAEA